MAGMVPPPHGVQPVPPAAMWKRDRRSMPGFLISLLIIRKKNKQHVPMTASRLPMGRRLVFDT
jgi:hypothetical protein